METALDMRSQAGGTPGVLGAWIIDLCTRFRERRATARERTKSVEHQSKKLVRWRTNVKALEDVRFTDRAARIKNPASRIGIILHDERGVPPIKDKSKISLKLLDVDDRGVKKAHPRVRIIRLNYIDIGAG